MKGNSMKLKNFFRQKKWMPRILWINIRKIPHWTPLFHRDNRRSPPPLLFEKDRTDLPVLSKADTTQGPGVGSHLEVRKKYLQERVVVEYSQSEAESEAGIYIFSILNPRTENERGKTGFFHISLPVSMKIK